MRRIKIQVIFNLLVVLIGILISKYLIVNYKILGASLTYAIMIVIRLILYYCYFIILMKKLIKKEKNPIKVLHLLSSNKFSGAENVVCNIIEKNYKYEMFYCSLKGPIEEILINKNINFLPIKNINPISLFKICKKNNISIIHAHDYKASFCFSFTWKR